MTNHLHGWADPSNIAHENLECLKKQRLEAYGHIWNSLGTPEVARARIGSIDQAIHDIEFAQAMRWTRRAFWVAVVVGVVAAGALVVSIVGLAA